VRRALQRWIRANCNSFRWFGRPQGAQPAEIGHGTPFAKVRRNSTPPNMNSIIYIIGAVVVVVVILKVLGLF
jgi:hypothetical protein